MNLKRVVFSVALIIVLLVPATFALPRTVAAACDAATFIADVTIPDGSTIAPGVAMAKTWRLQNSGTCTWSTSYAIVFYAGSQMGAPSVVYMPTSVAPGATVDITVNMVAPTTPGHYRGYWMVRNASSVIFGVGPYGTWPFFIDIVVTSTSYGIGYDFVANYCSATWASGAGALPCPGTDGAASGFVFQSAAPQLENGSLDTVPGLIVGPQNIADGYIAGTYPPFTVQSGDRFQSVVSCQYGVSSCYVTFRLKYQIGSGPVYTFWTFREKTEGNYYRANLDLSSLAGQTVKFTLEVSASGSPAGDRVVWGGARIARAGSVPTPGLLASTTTISADTPDPSTPTQAVAVSVNVSGSGATPTGTVSITGADTNCTITLVAGSGSCNVVFNTAGAKTLTALYNGDATYATSSDTEGHTVSAGLAASTTTITADVPDPSTPGQAVAVYVTVSGAGLTPTGTVAITGANTNCTITLVAGSGSCNAVFNTTGAKTITATYSGDTNYSSSSDTESHTVTSATAASATTIVSHIPDPSTPGQAVVVSVTVSGAGIPVPSGTVNITGADTNCSILLAGGSGSCSVTFNTVGTKTLTATYSGDLNYASSLGTASHTVAKGSTTTIITADNPDPSVPSQPVAVTVTVFGAGAAPTGTVGITGADINCTVILVGGTGSCNAVFYTIGAKTLTATYSGDSNYFSSTDTEAHTVKNVSTTTITLDAPDPSFPGGLVTVNFTVSGVGPVPTGTVTITGQESGCAAPVVLAGGSGTCTLTYNTAGAKILTATYSGDAVYAPSVGAASHTVNKGPSTTTITTMLPLGALPNQAVAVTVTVTGAGVTPTGTVVITLSDGQTSTCTIPLVAGTGSCNVVFTTTGTFTVTATYSGDGNYVASLDTDLYTVP